MEFNNKLKSGTNQLHYNLKFDNYPLPSFPVVTRCDSICISGHVCESVSQSVSESHFLKIVLKGSLPKKKKTFFTLGSDPPPPILRKV